MKRFLYFGAGIILLLGFVVFVYERSMRVTDNEVFNQRLAFLEQVKRVNLADMVPDEVSAACLLRGRYAYAAANNIDDYLATAMGAKQGLTLPDILDGDSGARYLVLVMDTGEARVIALWHSWYMPQEALDWCANIADINIMQQEQGRVIQVKNRREIALP